MTSPSSSSMSRKTPCVAGCDGPILSTIFSPMSSLPVSRRAASAAATRVTGSGDSISLVVNGIKKTGLRCRVGVFTQAQFPEERAASLQFAAGCRKEQAGSLCSAESRKLRSQREENRANCPRHMAKKIALLFAGQGAQCVGMGHDLAEQFPVAADLFRHADEILGRNLSEIAWNGPIEELTKTSNCQPALYVHGLAALAALRDVFNDFDVGGAAGLSLGELTAHAAGGTFDFATGLRLVQKRGVFMDEACATTQGGMAAMIGGLENDVRQLAADEDVDIANINAPNQIVISGELARVETSVGVAKEY